MVSVVIPVYNVERYLSACVDSILAQTHEDLELLLVDDGSTDASARICDEYAERDCRVRVFHKQNEGVSRARNYGLEHARGEWVWFVDSDDRAETDALQRFAEVLEAHPGMDVYKCGFVMEREAGDMEFSIEQETLLTSTAQMVLTCETCCYTGFLWNMIFHRSLLGDVRFDEGLSYCEDHLFSFNVFAHARQMFVDPKQSYHYMVRTGGGTLSNTHRHSALSIVKAACQCRDAKLRCIEPTANREVVAALRQKIQRSHRSQLYVAFDVLYSHPFSYAESRQVFALVNARVPVFAAWLYYYARFKVRQFRHKRALR